MTSKTSNQNGSILHNLLIWTQQVCSIILKSCKFVNLIHVCVKHFKNYVLNHYQDINAKTCQYTCRCIVYILYFYKEVNKYSVGEKSNSPCHLKLNCGSPSLISILEYLAKILALGSLIYSRNNSLIMHSQQY